MSLYVNNMNWIAWLWCMFVQIRDPTDLQGRAQLVCAGGAGHNSAVGKQPEDLLVSDGASSIFIVLLHVCLSVCLSLSLSLSLSLAGTTELISTRLDTKHPWVKENQFCSNDYEGDHLSPTGNNSKIVKWYWIFFSRTKLEILQSKRKGIQFWSN